MFLQARVTERVGQIQAIIAIPPPADNIPLASNNSGLTDGDADKDMDSLDSLEDKEVVVPASSAQQSTQGGAADTCMAARR